MLAEMAVQYPYATVLHVLLAKSRQQHADARSSLATAALYSPNRHVLRLVMENTLPAIHSAAPPATPPAAEIILTPVPDNAVENSLSPVAPSAGVSVESDTDENVTSDAPQAKEDIFDELQRNLKRLREERIKHYEQPESQGESTEQMPSSEAATPAGAIGITETVQQVIADHEQQIPENPKIQEQRSLIDSFLENAPSLQRRQQLQANAPEEVTDLSQQTSTPLDLATETLALIMKKQGKTEKAIDIYEKLVLKYPQKSAYFANCIEQLKKDL